MKPQSLFTFIGVLAIASCIVFGGAHVASALTVTPPLSELDLTPGEKTQTKIKLYNETENSVALYSEVVNFGAAGETGTPTYDFASEKIGLSKWIVVTPGPIHIEPGNSAEVAITINTPADAEPGGHYAVVFFSENPPSDGSQVAIGTKVGTLYLADVDGDVTENAEITEFGTGASSYNRLPVDFFTRFHNTGSVHLRPTGEIAIKNMFGKVADTVEVNVTQSATLPSQIRKYESTWEKAMVDSSQTSGVGGFFQEYKNELHNFAIGRYTATVVMTAQATNSAIQKTATTQFWVIPWHVLLLDGLLIVVIILLLIFIIRRYNKWIIQKAGGHTSADMPAKKIK